MKDSAKEAEMGGLRIPVLMVKRNDGERLIAERQGKVVKLEAKRIAGDDHCIICRDVFNVGDTVLRMPSCVHCFHDECAMMWLKSHNSCPTCRRELPTDDARYEEERRLAGRSHAGGSRQATGWEEMLFG
jgi:hypothetical protein